MNLETIITFILVIGLVWGGFSFFLIRAIKYEKIKQKDGSS